MTRNALRRFVAALAAYLVLLHALGMGAMAAPETGRLLVICSIDAHASAPASPTHTPAEHPPCALCGLGACAVVPSTADALQIAVATASIAVPPAVARVTPARPAFDAASPRGPPALA